MAPNISNLLNNFKQFAGANKRRRLNNPLREHAKTLFLHR